uniref:PDZ domain-containing protein n=1 Tax=Oncorhynchus mykiss TaxID=8022 RepID=A0A8C7NMZ3_ONCMY
MGCNMCVVNRPEQQYKVMFQEVELYKSSQQDKLGLTVCYCTDDEEDLGIYVGEVNPNSIAAKNGRIREGDRILQINGIDIQNREEAVAILTREDSINFSLLLARPDIETHSIYCKFCRYCIDTVYDTGHLPSNSQELDSGVGRTDESTHNAESSEHDLLGEDQDQTSAPNTNTTNTPGSMRKFRPGNTPSSPSPHLQERLGLGLGGYEEEEGEMCEGEGGSDPKVDVNCNESMTQHEMALLEEELRHLEFKCRNILRVQKMQQLRERCMKAWLLEEDVPANELHRKLSDINELPERERSDPDPDQDKDSTSAYNTGGESCRTTPLVSTELLPLSLSIQEEGRGGDTPNRHSRDGADKVGSRRGWEKGGHGSLNGSFSPNSYRGIADGGTTTTPPRKSPRANPTHHDRSGGPTAESSPYFTRRRQGNKPPAPKPYQSCMQLPSSDPEVRIDSLDSVDRAVVPGMGLGERGAAAALSYLIRKVKIRSDGTRYVAKRPVRDRLLKARAIKIREERSGMTTDDDAVSEMKQGRYWSKEERKQQLLRAREHRQRREFMMQSRLDYLKGDRDLQEGPVDGKATGGPPGLQGETGGSPSILALSQKKFMKKRNKRILDNWVTIQELLAHGSRSPDGKKVYNSLLSVTTV